MTSVFDAMPKKKRKSKGGCLLCSGIPERQFVETLHTSERLPEEVAHLLVIGGYGLHGHEQVRKCPECGTYYSYLYDHDSESGVGYGYTDEAIVRLTPEEALVLIEKTRDISRHAVAYWRTQCEEGRASHAPGFLKKYQEELTRLETERDAIRKMLEVS